MAELRSGTALDAHRLVAGRPLVLGGVTIEHPSGLDGHSDADVVCHVLVDAARGALALPDIGRRYPGTAEWAGASSLELLRDTFVEIAALGYGLANADCLVIAAAPRLVPHLAAMRERLAAAMGADVARVNVRGTGTDGLGFTGRGEGIAALAVVVLRCLAAPAALAWRIEALPGDDDGDDGEGLVALGADDALLGAVTIAIDTGAEAVEIVAVDCGDDAAGIADALVEAAVAAGRARGCRVARAAVAGDDLVALGRCQRHGFRIVRVDGERLVLERALA